MRRLLCAVSIAAFAGTAFAGIIHDESINGDLSGDNINPTALTAAPGDNQVLGTITDSPTLDQDFFRFDVPAGFELTGVILDNYATNGDQQSFLAVQEGTKISDPIGGDGLLGAVLFGAAPGTAQGDDLLDDLGAANIAGSGFSGPLGPGTYTFWVQETAATVDYTLNFQLTAIPEPASLMLLGAMGLLAIRRR